MNYLHINLDTPLKEDGYLLLNLIYENEDTDSIRIFFEKEKVCNKLNIPLKNVKEFNFENLFNYEFTYCETDSEIFSIEQQRFDEEHAIRRHENAYFSLQKGKKGSKLVVTFPDFADGNSDLRYPLTLIPTHEDINYLFFQDRYLVNGTYMTLDNEGNDVEGNVIEVIKNILAEMDIKEEDILFFGISKGGSIAIRYGSFFSKSTILAIQPQYNLHNLTNSISLSNTNNGNLIDYYFKVQGFESDRLNLHRTLEKIKKNKQTIKTYDVFLDVDSNTVEHDYKVQFREELEVRKEEYLVDLDRFITNKPFDYLQNIGLEERRVKSEKYLNIKFSNKLKSELPIKIYADSVLLYSYTMLPGAVGKYFNIVIPSGSKELMIESFESDLIELEIFTSSSRVYTDIEKEDMKEDICEDGIYYTYTKKETAKKLLVTFAGFTSTYGEHQYLVYPLGSINENDFIKLCIRDNYFDQGSYFLIDDDGNLLAEKITKLIKEKLKENNLEEEDLYIWGTSKGGYAVCNQIPFFKKANFIICAPQLDFSIFKRTRFLVNNGLANYLHNQNLKIEDLIVVKNLSQLKENSMLVSGPKDFSSTLNILEHQTYDFTNVQVDSVHASITSLAAPIWSNFTNISNVEEKVIPRVTKISDNFNECEFTIAEIVGCYDYADVKSFVDFVDIETRKVVYTTPIAKKTSDGKNINVFCCVPHKGYIHDFSMNKYKKDAYILQLRVFFKRKLFIGEIVYNGNTYLTINPNNNKINLYKKKGTLIADYLSSVNGSEEAHLIKLNEMVIDSKNTMFIEGYSVIKGKNCVNWNDINTELVFRSKNGDIVVPLAKAFRPNLSSELFDNFFVNYDRGWFTTPGYKGINIAHIPIGEYKVLIRTTCSGVTKTSELKADNGTKLIGNQDFIVEKQDDNLIFNRVGVSQIVNKSNAENYLPKSSSGVKKLLSRLNRKIKLIRK